MTIQPYTTGTIFDISSNSPTDHVGIAGVIINTHASTSISVQLNGSGGGTVAAGGALQFRTDNLNLSGAASGWIITE